MSPTEEAPLELFENDEFLKQFLQQSGGDVRSQALFQTLTVTERLAKLTKGISILDKELQKQVLENHEDLLSQASWIEKLEGVLVMMTVPIQDLLTSVERIRSKISKPFNDMVQQNNTLRNVLCTLDMVRRVERVQTVCKQLKLQVDQDSNNIVNMSHIISELDLLWNERDLSGLTILEAEHNLLQVSKKEVGQKAREQLRTGLQNGRTHAELIPAVRALYYLGCLEAVSVGIVDSTTTTVRKAIVDNLDISKLLGMGEGTRSGPGRAAMPAPGQASAFNQRLWTTVELLFEELCSHAQYIETLELALRQNRSDILTRSESYLDTFSADKRQLTLMFWSTVTDALAGQLTTVTSKSHIVKDALAGEYPRLLKLYTDLCRTLQATERPDGVDSPFYMNKDVTEPFEKEYVRKSSQMVMGQVQSMFILHEDELKPKAPTAEEVNELIKTVTRVMNVSMFDTTFNSTIAKNVVVECVSVFCRKSEGIIDKTSPAVQVINSPTTAQQRNVELATVAATLKSKVQTVTSSLGTDSNAAAMISMSLAKVDTLITQIISPMLASLELMVQKILLTLDNEDFTVTPSLYMRELCSFISRSYEEYLQPFPKDEVVRKCCQQFGKRCLELFLIHVALVRPLDDGRRAKLAADCSLCEKLLGVLLEEDPASLRLLRSFRLLLTETPEQIADNPVVGEVVPYSLVLLHLFSYAPKEMQSPHTCGLNWTKEYFCKWLDEKREEKERLELISTALASYCRTVTKDSPSANFDPLYGVMVRIIEKNNQARV